MTEHKVLYSTLTDDPDFSELVAEFVGNIPARITQIRDCVAKADLADLSTRIHQLRGACGSYGFNAVTPLAAALETLLRAGAPVDMWGPKLEQFIEICGRMSAESKPK